MCIYINLYSVLITYVTPNRVRRICCETANLFASQYKSFLTWSFRLRFVWGCALLQTATQINLTENQFKVIRDKYLRDDPSPDVWLRRVARNIALAEVLYLPKLDKDVFAGVQHKKQEIEVESGVFSNMSLLHHGLREHNERRRNFNAFMQNLYRVADEDTIARKIVSEWEEKFYWLLANFYFLPNSPTLMNAGRELQQLSACYVLPVDDSIEGWMDVAKNAAVIHQSGGGTGFAVSRVRPAGDPVKSAGGVASGPLSPLYIIDAVTQRIKQGGTRRGADRPAFRSGEHTPATPSPV